MLFHQANDIPASQHIFLRSKLMFSTFGTLERVKSATGRGINIFFSEMNAVILNQVLYRKIPKISPGAYIFQRLLLRGLFLEGLIFGGKLAFQNRLG